MLLFRRANIAAADVNETCCSRIILTRVAKPGLRAHSGGGPYCFRMTARSLSRRARSLAARARLSLVSALADAKGAGSLTVTAQERKAQGWEGCLAPAWFEW